jgi:hypothetical protein
MIGAKPVAASGTRTGARAGRIKTSGAQDLDFS